MLDGVHEFLAHAHMGPAYYPVTGAAEGVMHSPLDWTTPQTACLVCATSRVTARAVLLSSPYCTTVATA